MRYLLPTLLALSLLAPALHAEEALLEVKVTKDLAYVAGEDVPDRQKLDLYVPVGEGPWPVLLWIHGGAWAVGHRSDEEALARRFAERGVAVAAIDHRMSKALWMDPKLDEGIEHPAHVQDVAAAFAWLRKNAAARALDPKRMFVGGFSSGAHLEAHGEKMAEQHVLAVPMLVLSEADTLGYTKLFEDAVKKAGLEQIRFRHFPERRHATMGKLMARKQADDARDAMIEFIRPPAAGAR